VPSLIEIQLEVLLTRDAQGRLVATRDSTPGPAPRLYLARSRDGNLWAMRRDLDSIAMNELHRLCSAEPSLSHPSAERRPMCRERVHELLAPVPIEFRGPCYVLPEQLPQDNRARLIEAEERGDWLERWPWFTDEFAKVQPVAIAFDAGEPASVCHSPRGRTAFAAEAGVETLERFRGRGLATAAVACWARAVQRTGRVALYSTTWENAASKAIARRLSAHLYGENWSVT
jgi:hypothetical protein